MAKKIGIRIYLDGASQFNNDVKGINNSLKQLQSEMKVNSEQFKTSQNSFEALSNKSKILNQQYEEAGKKVDAYSKRISELHKAREEDQKNLETYTRELQKEKEKLEEIERTLGKDSEEYSKQAVKVSELETAVNKTYSSLDQLDNKEVQLQTSMNNATAEQIKYGNELNQTNAYLEEAKNSTDGCAKSIDQYGHNVSGADEATKKLSDQLKDLTRNEAFEKINEGAKKLFENMMECAEVAEQFEYSMAKVQSIARVDNEALAGMSEEIRRVGQEMGYSSNEIAEAVYQAISASVDASEAIGFVEDATKLARAGFTDATSAVDVLTTAINAYGKEANTTAHIADDLITTQNLGKTTVNELAQALGTVIPTASALGVSLDQLSSMYVLMTKQGINTANATTYIRAMMNELSDSGSDLADTFGELTGQTFGAFIASGHTVGDAMQVLGESVNGDSEAFKNLFSNVRAGLGALSLFNQGADAFNEALNAMETNAGATEEAFGIMADTAVMTNERFKVSIENLKIAIGESLSPAIDGLKKKGIDILESITNVVEANPELVKALAGATAAIGGVAAIATTAAAAVALFRLAFGDVSSIGILVAAGLTGVAGGFAAVALSADDATESIRNHTKELKDAHKANNELAIEHINNAANAKNLAERYQELAHKSHLSNEEFAELNTIITKLNDTVPGITLAYRKQKDAIDESTIATQDYIDAMIEELQYQNQVEDLTNAYKEQAEAKTELEDVTLKLGEAQAKVAAMEENHSNVQLMFNSTYREAKDRVEELTAAQEAAQAVYDTNQQNILSLTTAVNEYDQKLQENAATEEEAAAANYALEQAQKDMEEAFAKASAAIDKQTGILSEWNTESKATGDEMIKIWEGQAEGLETYKEDLIKAKSIIDGDFDPSIKNLTSSMVQLDDAATLHDYS